jgi:hypothetical protein
MQEGVKMEIVVIRPKQYADRLRAYKLYIDSKPVAEIKAGQEIRLLIPQNSSKLLAKVDWCSSNEFDLSAMKENGKIEIANAISKKKAWIPFYVIYAITVGRKQYLRIEKAA